MKLEEACEKIDEVMAFASKLGFAVVPNSQAVLEAHQVLGKVGIQFYQLRVPLTINSTRGGEK